MASQDRYPYLAYCSLEFIALSCPHGCTKCWFIRVSNLLESTYTSMDRLLPFKYSMDAPGHLLHTRQELKRILLDDIYRHYVGHLNKPSRQVTSEDDLLRSTLHKSEGWTLIIQPTYNSCQWAHSLSVPLGQFQVGSHRS